MGRHFCTVVAFSLLLAAGDATGFKHENLAGGAALTGFVPALSLRNLGRASSISSCARRGSSISTPATATATAATAEVPASQDTVDPFLSAQPDMRRLKQKIKVVIDKKLGSGENAHPLLQSSSREFFERSEKTWRPMAALLLSRALKGASLEAADPAHHDDAMVIAEIVEIMHTSTVIHDTVLEDYEAFEKGNMAHRIYSSSIAGNKVSILAGDFLLSRASVLLSSLRNTEIVEIMAGALEAIMKGQMQLHRPVESAPVGMDAYIGSLETRSGNLLGSGCQCAAMVAGYSRSSDVAQAAFAYGMNLGVGYQIIKDLAVTEANYDKLFRKMHEGMASQGSEVAPIKFDPYELNEPLQRAGALMYAVDKHPELAAVARSGFEDIDSLLSARELIIGCDAIGGVRERARHHRDLAVEALAALPDSDSKTALVTLANYLTEPNQNRLQRKNYDTAGLYTHPEEEAPKTGTQLTKVLKDAKKGAKMGMFSMREKIRKFMGSESEIG